MDPEQLAEYTSKLGNCYKNAAIQLQNYLDENIDQLSPEDREALNKRYDQLNHYGTKLLTCSDEISFASSDPNFKKICDASTEIQDSIDKIASVNHVTTITAAMLSLAGGILNHDSAIIKTALQTIGQNIKKQN